MHTSKLRIAATAGITVFLVAAFAVLAQPPGGGQAPDSPPAGRGGPGPQMPPGGFGPMRLPVMMALDANGDGDLSAEEIASAPQTLSKLDKNGDGKLGREEILPQFGDRRGPGGPGERSPGPGGAAQGPADQADRVASADRALPGKVSRVRSKPKHNPRTTLNARSCGPSTRSRESKGAE